MSDKLRDCFEEMAVYKNLGEMSFLKTLKLPSFLRDWVLKQFEDDNGKFDVEDLLGFVNTYMPRKEDWLSIKNRISKEYERVKLLTRIDVDIDIKTGTVSFELPDYGLTNKETIIEDTVWDNVKDELVRSSEIWGIVELTSPALRHIVSILISIRMCVPTFLQKNGLMFYWVRWITIQVAMKTNTRKLPCFSDFFLLWRRT